jgi:hypothetical protein
MYIHMDILPCFVRNYKKKSLRGDLFASGKPHMPPSFPPLDRHSQRDIGTPINACGSSLLEKPLPQF